MRFSILSVALLVGNAIAARGKPCSESGQGGQTRSVPQVSHTPVSNHHSRRPTSAVTRTPSIPTPSSQPIRPSSQFTPPGSVQWPTDIIEIPTSVSSPVVQPTTLQTIVSSVAVTTTSSAPAATSSVASSPGTSTLTADEQAALDAHNDARAEVGNVDLVWDTGLVADAQEWADHLASLGSLEHSSVSDQGECLFQTYTGSTPYTDAVKAFVSEKSSYNGEAIDSSNYLTFGHYTQVIWKSTTKVGMAKASGSDGSVYVVARYSPPGNYIGEKPY
ncbi:unnamed protein product [Clonostachys rosea f. rosea IK726]|uniref:SCP domain-containing protein n=2 Tax=Bionectria ochroleuca TaxID=29856 RepID=A0A0B7K3B9_BIOOC|nr:unnamed protein product [Clonostachys rosea f. rosea IK726]